MIDLFQYMISVSDVLLMYKGFCSRTTWKRLVATTTSQTMPWEFSSTGKTSW